MYPYQAGHRQPGDQQNQPQAAEGHNVSAHHGQVDPSHASHPQAHTMPNPYQYSQVQPQSQQQGAVSGQSTPGAPQQYYYPQYAQGNYYYPTAQADPQQVASASAQAQPSASPEVHSMTSGASYMGHMYPAVYSNSVYGQQMGGAVASAPGQQPGATPQQGYPSYYRPNEYMMMMQQQQQNLPQAVSSTPRAPSPLAATVTDPSGQTAPAGIKPKVTTTLWEDEGTMCFQVEARGICVARREDNDMINGTKLLNVAGMTRGRRDGLLKGERDRHVVKAGAMHLKGVWIPYERALDFANKEKITDYLYPLFVSDIKAVLYNPANTAQSQETGSKPSPSQKHAGTHSLPQHSASGHEGGIQPTPKSEPQAGTPVASQGPPGMIGQQKPQGHAPPVQVAQRGNDGQENNYQSTSTQQREYYDKSRPQQAYYYNNTNAAGQVQNAPESNDNFRYPDPSAQYYQA